MTLTADVGDWCDIADVMLCAPCAGLTLDTTVVTTAIQVSSFVVYQLSGRQYTGIISDTIRPNRDEWAGARGIGSVGLDGEIWGSSPQRNDYATDRNLGLGPISEIRLPGYPVQDITEVRVDGQIVPSSAYRINDNRWLMRIDGGFWPVYQNLTKDPMVDVGTFQIIYRFGVDPPIAGNRAAAALACEIAKACTGVACALPERITSVARQGLSVAVLDPQDFLDHGRTGIYIVDSFIKAVNPNGIQQRASGFSPDVNWPAHRLR